LRHLVKHWRLDKDDGVMHDALVAGAEFGGLNPFVFGEIGRHADVDVIVRAFGW